MPEQSCVIAACPGIERLSSQYKKPPHRNYCSHEAVSYLVDFFVFSIVGDAGVLELELTVDPALGTLTEALTQRR